MIFNEFRRIREIVGGSGRRNRLLQVERPPKRSLKNNIFFLKSHFWGFCPIILVNLGSIVSNYLLTSVGKFIGEDLEC